MEAQLRWTDPSAREVWRRAQQQSPHLRDMLQYGLVTEDFAGAIPDLLRSVVFLDHFYGFWDPETRSNRDVSYVVFTPHPHLAADPDRLLASGEVLVAHRFWIAGSTGLSGQDIVHTLVSAPPDPLRPPDAIRAVARYSKGGRRYVGDTPLRTPPLRDLVVFDDRDLAGIIRRGGVPPFRKGRLTVTPSPSDARRRALGAIRWAEYPGVAPVAIKTEPLAYPVTYREIPPRDLAPQFPGLALEAGPHDPSPGIRDTIRVLRADDQFNAVLSTMTVWSKWLGASKAPPLGLLRALVFFMGRRQARATEWGERGSEELLGEAVDIVLDYRPLLTSDRALRTMVAQDMVLFDTLGELRALVRHGNIQRDLASMAHTLLPPNTGRFLLFVTRTNRPLGDPRSLYRIIVRASDLADATAPQLFEYAPIRPAEAAQAIASLAGPEAGLLRQTTHLLGFGNPRTGPLFSTSHQVYRLAPLHTQEQQRATGGLIGPWTYYEGGDTAEPLTQVYE